MTSECLIFLDIDGVLNSDEWILDNGELTVDPENVRWLNLLIRESSAEVVVTSDWRKWLGWEDLCSLLLNYGLEVSFRGKTPELGADGSTSDALVPRGFEIDRWLKESGYQEPSVILDDRDDMQPHESRLIQTDYETGLTGSDVRRALEILSPSSP